MNRTRVGLIFVAAAVFIVAMGFTVWSPAHKGDYIISKADPNIVVAKHISKRDARSKSYEVLRKNKQELIMYIVEDPQLYKELKVGDEVKVTPKTDDKGSYVVSYSDPPQIVAGQIIKIKE